MKIVSQFKDYYDYVAHVYGGGDHKVVYNRKRIGHYDQSGSMGFTRRLEVAFKDKLTLDLPYRVKSVNRWGGFDGFHWLIVCGRPYPLINMSDSPYSTYSRDDKWEVFDIAKHSGLVDKKEDFLAELYTFLDLSEIGVERPELVLLSKAVGHPVFMIDAIYGHRGLVVINGECPVLSNVGLATHYPAEQLYQDLSYFLVNKMQDSPDVAPTTLSTDKEKIVQHGFDLQQSFRHRR